MCLLSHIVLLIVSGHNRHIFLSVCTSVTWSKSLWFFLKIISHSAHSYSGKHWSPDWKNRDLRNRRLYLFIKGEGDCEAGPGVDSENNKGDQERDQKACLQYARPSECIILPNSSPSFCFLELLFTCLLPPYDLESWTLTAWSCCKGTYNVLVLWQVHSHDVAYFSSGFDIKAQARDHLISDLWIIALWEENLGVYFKLDSNPMVWVL